MTRSAVLDQLMDDLLSAQSGYECVSSRAEGEGLAEDIRVARKAMHTLLEDAQAEASKQENDAIMSWECLMMVRETLEALGTDMEATPPMMYPEAIQATVFRWCQQALAGELMELDGAMVQLKEAV